MTKSDKPSIVEFYRNLAGLLMDEQPNMLSSMHGELGARFYVTHPSPGAFHLLRSDEPGIVYGTTRGDVGQVVAKFLDRYASDLGSGYLWGPRQLQHFIEYWEYLAPAIPTPATWRWANEEGLTYHRLPWTRGITGETPTWDALCSRMDENRDALKAWIGSLFFNDSDRQQYVWLYGRGNDGKGALMRFLGRVFGNAFKSCEAPERGDKFWSFGNVLGKRLVAFPDTNNIGFPASGFFKMLTGGDAIPMEIKGGAAFSTMIDTKFVFASNARPSLSSEKADLRRIIFVEFTPGDVDTSRGAEFEAALWAEGGAFLTACIAAYELACPHRGRIVTNASAIEEWVAGGEDYYDSILSEFFVLQPGARECSPAAFAGLLHQIFKGSRADTRSFSNWLERKHNVRRASRRSASGGYDHVVTNILIGTTSAAMISRAGRLHIVE